MRWLLGGIRRIWAGLAQEKVPLWIHILTLILTAIGTWILAPDLNEKFEQQKIKSAFVIDALNGINQLTGDLAVSITVYNYCESTTPGKCSTQVREAQGNIVRLQWKALQLATVLRSQEDGYVIADFQKSLEGVAIILNAQNTAEKHDDLLRATELFGRKSVSLVERVARQAGIGEQPRALTH